MKTNEYRVREIDLKALQDEALADRAWIKVQKLDRWDGKLVFGNETIQKLEDLQSNFIPYLLREYSANGKLEKWLENNGYTDKAQQIRQIPQNSTKVEVVKALYEIIFENEVSQRLKKLFELDVRWHALQKKLDKNLDKMFALSQKLVDLSGEEWQSVRDMFSDLSEQYQQINELQYKLFIELVELSDENIIKTAHYNKLKLEKTRQYEICFNNAIFATFEKLKERVRSKDENERQ